MQLLIAFRASWLQAATTTELQLVVGACHAGEGSVDGFMVAGKVVAGREMVKMLGFCRLVNCWQDKGGAERVQRMRKKMLGKLVIPKLRHTENTQGAHRGAGKRAASRAAGRAAGWAGEAGQFGRGAEVCYTVVSCMVILSARSMLVVLRPN